MHVYRNPIYTSNQARRAQHYHSTEHINKCIELAKEMIGNQYRTAHIMKHIEHNMSVDSETSFFVVSRARAEQLIFA